MNKNEFDQPITFEQRLKTETDKLSHVFTELRIQYDISSPHQLMGVLNEDVTFALKDHTEWVIRVDRLASGIDTQEAKERAIFLVVTFYVSAGYSDKEYLLDVIDDLTEDEERAKQLGLDNLALTIQAKIQEIITANELS
ncbi:MAG: hypothetical protein JWO54_818 [Candidatus Saccharibacteria bacterium]|nr:hypothetical protein [Candidatus Saccharibacteria bacterium]